MLNLPKPSYAQSQQPRFAHITVAEGLPENSIFEILQDHLGFLWLGMLNGLARYDGLTMTTYQPDPDNPYSISGLGIRALHEGPTGDLWIGTWRNGLNHFDRATERFTSYRHDPEDPRSLSYDFVRFVHEDKHGEVWVITDHWQLDKLDRDTGTFTRYRHDPHDPSSLSDDWIARRFVAGVPAISFLEDREGTIWIGTFGAGLNRYDRATDSFTRFTSPTYSTNPPVPFHTLDTLDRTHRSIASILQVENVQPLTQSFEVAAETPVLIVAMGEFFLGQRVDYGWLENEEGEVVWEMVLEQSYHAGGASDNRVQMETVLVAPGAYQLFYQSDGAHAFEHWTVAPPDRPERWGIQVYALTGTETFLAPENERKAAPGTIAGDYVFALLEDAAGMLWIGTSGGLSKHDRMTGTFTTYRSHQTGQKADPVYALYEDRRGRLWVVTRDAGLSRFDPETGAFTPYGWDPDDPRRLSSNNLLPVHEEAEGRLWLLTNTEGINIFDPETTTVTRVRHDPGNPHSLGPGTIRSVYTDQTGILWVGTWQGSKETSILGGLHKMDPSTRKFQPYRLDSNGTGSLRNNIAEAICEDHQGVLWIGTSQTGLLRYDPATERYTGYRHDPENPTSLSHDFVSAIYEDASGVLWIGTHGGGAQPL